MVHKDITMERIKELEDKLDAERLQYENKIKRLQANVASERTKYVTNAKVSAWAIFSAGMA